MVAVRRAMRCGVVVVTLAYSTGSAAAVDAVAPGGNGTLLIWINGDKGYRGLQKVGDAYAKRSGIAVVVEHPEDPPVRFQQAAAAGQGPDIGCWSHDHLGDWVAAGWLRPVTPSRKTHDAILDEAWRAFQLQGKTWGYPLSVEAIGLIYNKALVKQPPRSFDDVIRLDKQLAAKNKKAILWEYNNIYFTWPLLAAGGGYVFGRDARGEFDPRKVGVNVPGAVKGAELVNALLQGGVLAKGASYQAMETAFNKGEIAMMISGSWAWDNARKSHIDFGVAPIPDVAGRAARPFVGVIGCMITAASRNPEAARDFLENQLLTLDGLKTVNADVPLGTPANKALFKELADDPNVAATMESARRGEPMPSVPEMSRFWSAMAAALQAITNGRQSPKDALDAAAAKIEAK